MTKLAMISQPMNGLTNYQIQLVKKDAEKYLHDNGWEVRNTFFGEFPLANDPETKQIPVAYLAKSIEEMSKCDGVYFCDGWQNARGCVIEHNIAQAYGLEIIKD